MTIGSLNEDLHSKNDQPTVVFPYEDQKGFYTPIDVTQIRFGSEIMHGGQYYELTEITIDSGSTYTYFPKPLLLKCINFLDDQCSKSSKCWNITYAEKKHCYQV